MKTQVVSTRIPAGQATGSYNISLPAGFGVPKGFVVYAMDNIVQPNNFDSATDFPCLSVGFGGSNLAGTALTNICTWVSNQENADPSSTRSSFGNTVSIFSTNITGSVRRQWQMTGFAQDLILGTYQVTGTQQTPLDVVFTVFSGDDFFCAVGQTFMPAAANTITQVGTVFQPDAVLISHMRPAQTTDGNIHFGAAVRSTGVGLTTVTAQVGSCWRNQDATTPSACTARVDNGTAGFNLATNATIRVAYLSSAGIAFTQSSTSAANAAMYMAMKAGTGDSIYPSFAAGTFISVSAAGSTFYPIGFAPEHIIGSFSHVNALNTTGTTPATGADMISYFTASGYNAVNTVGIGTFTSSTSTTAVTGVGTSFLQQLGAIDNIYNLDYQLVGIVSSVTSNTALILQSNAAITATGSSFIFEKPLQFSCSYGNLDGSATANQNLRGYFSNDAIVSFTATTPTLQAVGDILNFYGEPGFTVNYSTLTNGARYGWYFAIRNDEIYRRRRGRMA